MSHMWDEIKGSDQRDGWGRGEASSMGPEQTMIRIQAPKAATSSKDFH